MLIIVSSLLQMFHFLISCVVFSQIFYMSAIKTLQELLLSYSLFLMAMQAIITATIMMIKITAITIRAIPPPGSPVPIYRKT